jgi:DNA mismatch endonuclease (patch repair protein)
MDKITKEQRSKLMSKIRSKDTKPEVLLAKALWHKGCRYRKHDRSIFGTPDLSFKKYKIAIFVDSDFFHGKYWSNIEKRPKTNIDFWVKKIERNIARDIMVNAELRSKGWTVLRFWSDDVEKRLYNTVKNIAQIIEERRSLLEYK